MAHTEEHNPFVIIYEQTLSLYGFQHNSLTKNQWYENFNTKVDVGNTIGVTKKHEAPLECNSQQVNKKKFDALQGMRRKQSGQTPISVVE